MESLLEKYGWYEWICHTNFSFLIGGSHPHEYVESAAAYGYRGLAITDYDGVYGLARAYRAWDLLRKHKEESRLGLFYGAEVHLEKDHQLPLVYQNTVVLLAQSRKGYFNLCRLLSQSHKEGKRDAHICFSDFISADLDDLVVILPMRGFIRRKAPPDFKERLALLKAKFPQRLYFAVGRYLNPAEDCWLQPTLTLAASLQIPCLLSQDVYFHHASQKDLHDILTAMRHNRTVDACVDNMFVNSERSLHPLQKIDKLYRHLPIYEEALRHSYELAQSLDFSLKELRYYYPKR